MLIEAVYTHLNKSKRNSLIYCLDHHSTTQWPDTYKRLQDFDFRTNFSSQAFTTASVSSKSSTRWKQWWWRWNNSKMVIQNAFQIFVFVFTFRRFSSNSKYVSPDRRGPYNNNNIKHKLINSTLSSKIDEGKKNLSPSPYLWCHIPQPLL